MKRRTGRIWLTLIVLAFACAILTPALIAATYSLRQVNEVSGSARALQGSTLRWKSSVDNNEVPVLPMTGLTAVIRYNVASPYTVSLSKLPKGAYIIGAIVGVTTAFNAGSTNVLTVGTASDPDSLVDASDVTESSVGSTLVAHRPAILAEDAEYVLKFTQTGTAASAGVARVTILYCVPFLN